MWSYKRMEYLSLGNITERSLESILKDTKKTYIKKYTKYTNIPYKELKWKRSKSKEITWQHLDKIENSKNK